MGKMTESHRLSGVWMRGLRRYRTVEMKAMIQRQQTEQETRGKTTGAGHEPVEYGTPGVPCPISWHAPRLEERDTMRVLVPATGIVGCDLAFATLFLWQARYETKIAFADGCLLRRWRGTDGTLLVAYPCGSDLPGRARALSRLADEAAGRSEPLVLGRLTAGELAELSSLRPGAFAAIPTPEDDDYVYARSDLAELPGHRFVRKRNAISQFSRRHPGFQVLPLDAATAADALSVARGWLDAALAEGQNDAEGLRFEFAAITLALENRDALGLVGAVLYAEGRPAAMALASPVNDETADVHFEKALPEFARDHAYAVVNQGLAAMLTPFAWLNREEDMGDEGLRKAKLSYRPAAMIRRFRATQMP